jgi:beta-glucanase (GH16 family)
VKKILPLFALLLSAFSAHADVIQPTLTDKGFVVDMGDTGGFGLTGPIYGYKNPADGKGGSVKPVFQAAADGLSGTISYPGSPGDFKINVKISPTDHSIHFSYDQLPPSAQSVQFVAEFDAGQFRGGRFALNGQPLTDIPLELLKGQAMYSGQLDLVGRDGVGFTMKMPDGFAGFGDDRKFNPDGAQTYSFNYSWRLDPVKAANGFAITLQDLKVPVVNPPVPLPPGPPPDGKWTPIPELTDDFQGTSLDTTKWYDHDPGWGGRPPSYFAPNNVTVNNGLHLLARLQDPPESMKKWRFKNYSTACMVSKTPALYGYFECKARTMNINVDNAFWFYTPLPTPPSNQHVEEMDVFEIDGGLNKKFNRTLFNTLHVWKTPPDAAKKAPWATNVNFRMPTIPSDGYHRYALEWHKDVVRAYYDGYLFAEYKNTGWYYPESMLFDNEVAGQWFGVPKPEEFHSSFDVQYIHSWRRDDDIANANAAAAGSASASANAPASATP